MPVNNHVFPEDENGNFKNIRITLTKEEYKWLQELATYRKMSPSECIRGFIRSTRQAQQELFPTDRKY